MEAYRETVLEHEQGRNYFAVSTGEISFRNRLTKLAEKYPHDCVVIAHNDDGSVYYHVPVSWVKIAPPRSVTMTDEQKRAAADRMRNIRNKRKP